MLSQSPCNVLLVCISGVRWRMGSGGGSAGCGASVLTATALPCALSQARRPKSMAAGMLEGDGFVKLVGGLCGGMQCDVVRVRGRGSAGERLRRAGRRVARITRGSKPPDQEEGRGQEHIAPAPGHPAWKAWRHRGALFPGSPEQTGLCTCAMAHAWMACSRRRSVAPGVALRHGRSAMCPFCV